MKTIVKFLTLFLVVVNFAAAIAEAKPANPAAHPNWGPYRNRSRFVQAYRYTIAPTGFYKFASENPQEIGTGEFKNISYAKFGPSVNLVNTLVNKKIRAKVEGGRRDEWNQYSWRDMTTQPSFLERVFGNDLSGDCEDYVLTKKKLLVSMGVPSGNLLIGTVYTRSNDYHAILILRTRQGDFVLDNLTPLVLPFLATGHKFVSIQSPENPRLWFAVQ